MIDTDVNNKKSIKYYVKRYLQENKHRIIGKQIIDIPSGIGTTSRIILELGGDVKAYDLFPEYFKCADISCEQADLEKTLPIASKSAEMLICQEGIEHISNQLGVFTEFNRVLKLGGNLIITTPSYSSLSSKMNYLIFESENSRKMPPNEIDDVWMSNKDLREEVYFGHIFLIGLQKLRTIGKVSGFKIKEIRYVRLSKGSLMLFPIFYPLIVISSLLRYHRNMKKSQKGRTSENRKVYQEQLRINLNPKHLLNRHIFIVYEKEQELEDLELGEDAKMKKFDQIM